MCVVSMVTDHYIDKWGRRITDWPSPLTPGYPSPGYPSPSVPWPSEPAGTGGGATGTITITPQITQDEIDEFRRLLERAREYDARNNEPHCELDEKRELIKKIAKALGVEIDFV